MGRTAILALALAGGFGVDWLTVHFESADTTAAEPTAEAPVSSSPPAAAGPIDKAGRAATLDQLCSGALQTIDLTWPLSAKGSYWPGENYRPFELRTIATLPKDGVLSKAFSMPEHQGTHIDAPNHFVAERPAVDELPVADFFAPAVVIDISGRALQDADYRLSAGDLADWERQHGAIPERAIVLLATGWGRHFFDAARYRNQDVMGRMHFPGFSAVAVKWLIDKRAIRGIGVDTLSIDYGLSRDFAVHHVLGKAGRYGLENLAHLDQLPPRDFYLFCAPIKIETGSGGPTRVVAIVP